MVTLEQVSANIRLITHEGDPIRTFSGVRHDPSRNQVDSFLRGVNQIVSTPASNALLTARAAIVERTG